MDYDPNRTYIFTSEDGETFSSKGDNGYVWQAMTSGLPISVNSNGDWFVTPYIDRDSSGKITAYIPDWFKKTDAYQEWKDTTSSITADYAANMSTDDLTNLNKYLKGLGGMGTVQVASWKNGELYGLNNTQLQRYANTILDAYTELNGGGNAQFTIGDKTYDSLESFAIDYMYNKNREQVSQELTNSLDLLNKAAENQKTYGGYLPITNLVQKNPQKENPEVIQQKVADSLIKAELLQLISEQNTWKNGMFKGILDSSFQQQFMTGLASFVTGATANPVANLAAKAVGSMMGESRDPQVVAQEFIAKSAASGASLNGREAAISIGGISGTIGNLVLTYLEMRLLGAGLKSLGGAMADMGSVGATVGSFLTKTGVFASSFWGTFTADLFLNDIPQDLAQFFTKVTNTGDWNGALLSIWGEGDKWSGYYDKEGKKVMIKNESDTQKLIPVAIYPTWDDSGIVSMGVGLGPEVPSGLLTDLAGDVIADLTMPFVNMLFNTIPKKVDAMTGGSITRIHDNIALKNFQIQEFLGTKTITGRAVRKMVDGFMGSETAGMMRQAKKDAVAQHDMFPYTKMANAITARNHGGSESVIGAYRYLEKARGITDDINKFQKQSKQYGGMGKTRIEWESNRLGKKTIRYKEVPDIVPRKVRETLDAMDELSDLQRKKEDGGGIISGSDQGRIDYLQKKISEAPEDIRDFANRFSALNKDVEELGAVLGISDKDWVDHLVQDDRFKNYMTRQALVPDYKKMPSEKQAEISAQWTKKRDAKRGDFAYVDPVVALRLKVVALGRSVADNEIAKAVAGTQYSQDGAILRGSKNIEYTKRIDEINKEIKHREGVKARAGLDEAKGNYTKGANDVKQGFTAVFDAMLEPEEINLRSIYQGQENKAVTEHIQKIESGKIRIGDGATQAAGLTDNEAAAIISNTYRVGTGSKVERNVPDNTKDPIFNESAKSDNLPTYAGVTDDGVPYSYTIEKNKVTSFERITSPEGLADSAKSLGYDLTPEAAKSFGAENVAALNRAALFYNSNVPNLPFLAGFDIKKASKQNNMGWIEGVGNKEAYNYRFENGKIAADFKIYCAEKYYQEKNGKNIDNALKKDAASRFHPKNSEDRASVPIHELGHSFMHRLVVLDINRRMEEGDLKAWGKEVERLSKTDPAAAATKIAVLVKQEWVSFQEKIAKQALDDLGVAYNGNNWKKKWREMSSTISKYAADQTNSNYKWETFSEAFVDYWANGPDCSPFTTAIMNRLFEEGNRYGQAAAPKKVMIGNGLDVKGIFDKNGEYDFGGAKTAKQKAKWLNQKRQENPYVKKRGIMTAEDYKKANLWDTFFRKEALSYDKEVKTKTPEALLDANNKFQENMAKNKTKVVMDTVKRYSDTGLEEEVATMLLSKNANDVSDALRTFITKNIDAEAEKIAKNMSFDKADMQKNMDKARVTLYTDEDVIGSTVNMVESMVPDMSRADLENIVRGIMDDNAKGFASMEALPTDVQALRAEVEELKAAIKKENKAVLQAGKKANKELNGEGTHIIKYIEDGQTVYVAVSDPAVASLLQRPENFKESGVATEALVHIGRFVARLYRLGTTGLNPIALVRNIIRDPVQAMYTSGFSPLSMNLAPDAFYRTLRNFGLDDYTSKQVLTKLKEWAEGQTLTKEIKNLNKGNSDVSTLSYRNKFEKGVKKLDKVTDNKIIDLAEHPLDAWEGMLRTQIAQQSFIKSFGATKNIETAMSRAMFDASNATTNFSHSINKFKRATSTIPYLTSAVNGTASFWRLFNVDPLGMVTRIMGGFVVPVMSITAWNLSSEERRKAYMNLPEWWRDGHLILLDADGHQIFAFTIPEEIKAYYGTARRLIEYTNDVSPSSLATIMAQGALGLLPGDTDGFVNDYGEWDLGRGFIQYASGLIPQAVNTVYELWAEENLYTGQDLSGYTAWNKVINTLSNVFGSGIKNVINDIGYMAGASENLLLGKTTADTLARDLFGIGFDNATTQFMSLIGNREEIDANGKKTKASGLFAERDELMRQLESMTRDAAYKDEDEQAKVEQEKQYLIDKFVHRVATLTNKYMQLYSVTGGLKDWQKKKVVSLLNLAPNSSSAPDGSYQALSANEANLDEYGLGLQRYIDAGLPGGATMESLARNENGNLERSLDVRAALNSYYGSSKQATADLINTATDDKLKDLKNNFYDAIQQIYDAADAQGLSPDYDMIERIQARYIQAIDGILMPIINQYGVNVLSNSGFVDEVRSYVNGMIPSDDWRQSTKNAKKYLSTKEFPTATVDVKKWLKQHYAASMKDRDIASDSVVTNMLNSIKSDIDNGNYGSASAKIESVMRGRDNADFYISPADLRKLLEYKNMLK